MLRIAFATLVSLFPCELVLAVYSIMLWSFVITELKMPVKTFNGYLSHLYRWHFLVTSLSNVLSTDSDHILNSFSTPPPLRRRLPRLFKLLELKNPAYQGSQLTD